MLMLLFIHTKREQVFSAAFYGMGNDEIKSLAHFLSVSIYERMFV